MDRKVETFQRESTKHRIFVVKVESWKSKVLTNAPYSECLSQNSITNVSKSDKIKNTKKLLLHSNNQILEYWRSPSDVLHTDRELELEYLRWSGIEEK